ncbi:MAG: cytochrome P450 [Pseudomonadales bacterium]
MSVDELVFDPYSDAFTADPYSTYAQLRARSQPTYFAPMDIYLLPWYEVVDAAARDGRMHRGAESIFSETTRAQEQRRNNWHDMPNHERFVQYNLLEQDGANHRKLRLVVMQTFTRTMVARHRLMIQTYVDELLSPLLEKGTFDFIEDFACHIPGHVIGRLLGLPSQDCGQLRQWVEDMVRFFDVDRSAAKKALAESATTELYHYLRDEIRSRKGTRGPDLLSTLVDAKDRGTIDETELIATAMLILAAGHGSTIDVMGTGLSHLLSHPDQLASLRRDPTLIPSAIQEMFRYETPLPFFHRYVSEPMVIRGMTFKPGQKVGLLYGAANRDPAFVENPDTFNIRRPTHRHLAFGRGAHLCLGNHLSRLDMEVIFETLVKQTRDIERVDSHLQYRPGLSTRGLTHLFVTLSPA